MNTESPRTRNYRRRSLGILLAAAPFFLLLASAAYGLTHEMACPWRGIGLAAVAALIGSMNFFLSFIRPGLYQLVHRSLDNYRHVSGIPMVGTLFVAVAGVYGFGSIGTAVICFGTLIVDTGGKPWFIYSTWRDQTFWDA